MPRKKKYSNLRKKSLSPAPKRTRPIDDDYKPESEEDSEDIDDEEEMNENTDVQGEWVNGVWRSCSLCVSHGDSFPQLDKHIFEDHKANRLCKKCGHNSQTFKEFTKHSELHTSTCGICKRKFLGITALRNHKKTHNKRSVTALKEKVPCNICGKLMGSGRLNTHLTQVHGNKDHKCDVCDYTSTTKAKIVKHRETHFKEVSICPECGKSVKHLANHFRNNCSGKPEEEHNCDQCTKTFKKKKSLKRHIRCVHEQIKNLHCTLCEYKTYLNSNLRVHEAKYHNIEYPTKECSICDQKTKNLDHHMKIYHFQAYLKNKASEVPQ